MQAITSDFAHKVICDKAKELGPIFRIRLAHIPAVLVTDPTEVSKITSRGDGFLDKSKQLYDAFNQLHKPDSQNMFTAATDETWKALRRAVAPCFANNNIKAAVPVILGACEAAVKAMKEAGQEAEWNFNDVTRRVTLDTIGGWGFGANWKISEDLLKSHPIVDHVNKVTVAVHKLYLDPMWPLRALLETSSKVHIQNTRSFDTLMETFTQELKQRHASGELPEGCIASSLLTCTDPATGKPLDGVHLRSNVSIFIAAVLSAW
ncbi:hypothetical protein CEUSTIGMA_g10453.t1 [Chlamydomonas eustigma]|uniref:Cytochrome P450 n=1 Tax=Chlamydomonas eustigma TaxID=1157962 RepID=A0A250XJ30_9CHLO|nr:hypothetical protein CEUSTIGMA_g10453.t1 [Chlamydomonas eustigma]|eukprot:GAX83026.1 hypothetical protein CEUSTIGMA_g10453.t1 [Chlamydomonas eustigma]